MKQDGILFTGFLFEAFYNWLNKKNVRIDIIVTAEVAELNPILKSHVKDGTVVLNISPNAIRNLDFGEHGLTFGARFGGTVTTIQVPYGCVMGVRNPEMDNYPHPINVYAVHTPDGVMMVGEMPSKHMSGEPVVPVPVPPAANRGGLRLVKKETPDD